MNRPTRWSRAAWPLVLGATGAWIVAQVAYETPFLMGRPARPLLLALVHGMGVALFGGALAAAILPPRLARAFGVASLALLTILLLVCVGFRPTSGAFTRAPVLDDPRFGLRAKPHSVSCHAKLPDFSVRYSFDGDGWRQIPDHAAAGERRDVVFLGCSFTFGLGVEDWECYPALLAKAWPDCRVRNLAIAGWGTTQALLVLRDELAHREPPAAVLYGYAFLHIQRNALRKRWHAGLQGIKTQWFELDEGRPVFRGSFEPSELSLADDSPELEALELELTVALIRTMAEECAQKGVPFFLLVFNAAFAGPEPDPVVERCRDAGIAILDLRGESGHFFEHDPHPTADWHRAIAAAILRDPRLAFLRSN